MRYNFVWDPVKAKTNARKHHVSFEKASAVFNLDTAIKPREIAPSTEALGYVKKLLSPKR